MKTECIIKQRSLRRQCEDEEVHDETAWEDNGNKEKTEIKREWRGKGMWRVEVTER